MYWSVGGTKVNSRPSASFSANCSVVLPVEFVASSLLEFAQLCWCIKQHGRMQEAYPTTNGWSENSAQNGIEYVAFLANGHEPFLNCRHALTWNALADGHKMQDKQDNQEYGKSHGQTRDAILQYPALRWSYGRPFLQLYWEKGYFSRLHSKWRLPGSYYHVHVQTHWMAIHLIIQLLSADLVV